MCSKCGRIVITKDNIMIGQVVSIITKGVLVLVTMQGCIRTCEYSFWTKLID